MLQVAPILPGQVVTSSAFKMEPLGEHGQSKYLRLARLMSSDKNLAIFRRFDDVNIMCLLGLQAEIVDLRDQFYKTNYADEKNAQQGRQFGESFLHSRENNSSQYQELEQLRERLIMYSTSQEFRAQAIQLTAF